MKLLRLSFLLSLSLAAHAEPPKFELRDGDRVLLLGDALLERENTLGTLEARMHAAWPQTKFTVRNLSWAGDTPKGWSRASFDAPAKGYERLKEQIALVKPTVVFLGYGMAASLQEMTDRSGDIMLNRDTARYGEEPMTAVRFKKELGELMKDIETASLVADIDSAGEKPRFVLLSPIQHEDLRATRPGTLDPARHNELLAQYSKSIEELAAERAARFVDIFKKSGERMAIPGARAFTSNGIHLKEEPLLGIWTLKLLANVPEEDEKYPNNSGLKYRPLVLKKNDLFFHRTRPANSTYIFGFRKHEQGRNAVEIPQFDPLVDKVDAEIDSLKRGTEKKGAALPAGRAHPAAGGPPSTAGGAPSTAGVSSETPEKPRQPLPLPTFTLEDGYEITLWADTALVGKPVGMNWDAAGRLWVACSPVYPQIAPGAHPEDKVVVIEDTDRDGKADKSTTFATDLLIAAGVAPDFAMDSMDKVDGMDPAKRPSIPSTKSIPSTPNAAYVGSSTELVHITDTDGDGKGDIRRVVLSGFGTEDTHHTIHTLKWGPDGRLYFNQSIYIHSHLETPYGMVRVNSGAIMAYDPRTERTEVIAKGWCNPWGHVWDEWGQQFTTDGAGGQGISWLVPGAMYFTYENAKRIMPSISPGSYPKFCGLELVRSPLFPADWQGDAITCDFRAHRIARFSIKDLSEPLAGTNGTDATNTSPKSPASHSAPKSGYETKAEPDLVRTTDNSFRPIDVKLGPDGALYVADWTNPVINHGEVDFRDPRRDHVNGRIWRIAPKGKEPVKWESLVGKKVEELLENLLSKNHWVKDHSRQIIAKLGQGVDSGIMSLVKDFKAYKEAGVKVDLPITEDFIKEHATAISTIKAIRKWREVEELPNDAEYKAPKEVLLEKAWLYAATGTFSFAADNYFPLLRVDDPKMGSAWLRLVGSQVSGGTSTWSCEFNNIKQIMEIAGKPPEDCVPGSVRGLFYLRVQAQKAAKSKNPRERLEAMRVLAKIPHVLSAQHLLEAAVNGGSADALPATPTGQFVNSTAAENADTHYAYAAWLSVSDLAPQVMEYVEKLAADPASAAKQQAAISFALQSLPANQTGPLLAKIIAKNGVPADGPWIELIGQNGGAAECEKLIALIAQPRAAAALIAAARRGVKPPGASLDVIKSAPAAVKADAIRLAGLWKLDAVEFITATMTGASPQIIDAAFDALATLRTPAAANTLEALLAKGDAGLRRRALEALANFKPDAVLSALSVVAADGDDASKLALFRTLFASEVFKGKFAAAVPSDLPKPAAAAALRAARELGKKGEALVATLTPLVGAPPAAPVDMAALVKATALGNPMEGEAIYRRIALACTACHAIGGAGGKVGPDMTTIGASAPLDYLVESMIAPNAKVKEGYNAVALTLKGGRAASGVLLRETPDTVFLRDAAGTETSVPKADITARENVGSIMPAGLIAALSDKEKASLMAFLSQLGKPGPFDATKASVARVWWLYPGKDVEAIVAGKIATPGAKTLTFTDGRLPKAALTEALQMVPDPGDMVVAVAKFAGSGKTRLNLTGVTKAYLDGAPLAIASNPSPEVDLAPGNHTLVVKLDTKQLPENLRVECPEGRFATE